MRGIARSWAQVVTDAGGPLPAVFLAGPAAEVVAAAGQPRMLPGALIRFGCYHGSLGVALGDLQDWVAALGALVEPAEQAALAGPAVADLLAEGWSAGYRPAADRTA